MDLNIRWMQESDLEEIKKIYKLIDISISEESISKFLNKKSSICIVAELDDKVVGFVFFEMKILKIKVSFIAVGESFRRKGIGSKLISALFEKLNEKRNKVEMNVSEYNLAVQLFLKKNNFIANFISNNPAEYKFIYSIKESA